MPAWLARGTGHAVAGTASPIQPAAMGGKTGYNGKRLNLLLKNSTGNSAQPHTPGRSRGYLRNIAVVLGNRADPANLPALEQLLLEDSRSPGARPCRLGGRPEQAQRLTKLLEKANQRKR